MKVTMNRNEFWKNSLIPLICVIAVMAFSNIAVPVIPFLVLFLCLQVFLRWEYGVAALFMCVPFEGILPLDKMILIFLVIWVCKEKTSRIKTHTFCLLILFFIIELVAEMRHGADAKTAIVLFEYIITATFISTHPSNNHERDMMASAFIGGLTLAILATMIISIKERSFVGMISTRLGMLPVNSNYRFTIGANGLGLMCAIGIAVQSQRLLYKIGKTLVNLILLIWFTSAGFLTQSRGFLVGLLFVLITFVHYMYKQRKLKAVHIIAIITIVALFGALYVRFLGDSAASLLLRFERNSEDITNGRVDINRYYLEHFFDDWLSSLFGYGLASYKSYLGGESIHNATIEMLVSWGILGFWVSAAWIIMLVRTQLKKGKVILTSTVPIWAVLLMVQSTRLFRTLVPIMYLTIALMSVRYSTSERDE